MAVKIARLEQKHSAELNKVYRTIDLMIKNRERKGVKTPKKELRDNEVLSLAEKHADKGCNLSVFIAQKLKISQRTVQRILKEKK